jgi:hypothetical protein
MNSEKQENKQVKHLAIKQNKTHPFPKKTKIKKKEKNKGKSNTP